MRKPIIAGNWKMHNTIEEDRKSTRLNSSHANISYAVFCLKKNTINLVSSVSPYPDDSPLSQYERDFDADGNYDSSIANATWQTIFSTSGTHHVQLSIPHAH